MMALTARQTRWMGLCCLVGGILWVADMGYLMRHDPTNPLRGYAHAAISLLFIAGLLGLWAQQRGRAGKAAKAGFILLLTSWVSWFALNVLGVFGLPGSSLVANVLALAWAFLLAPGFLLLGIGFTGAARIVPLVIAGAGLASALLPSLLPREVLRRLFPSVTNWNRGDTPIAQAAFFLMAVGLALMGYFVFRQAATRPSTSP